MALGGRPLRFLLHVKLNVTDPEGGRYESLWRGPEEGCQGGTPLTRGPFEGHPRGTPRRAPHGRTPTKNPWEELLRGIRRSGPHGGVPDLIHCTDHIPPPAPAGGYRRLRSRGPKKACLGGAPTAHCTIRTNHCTIRTNHLPPPPALLQEATAAFLARLEELEGLLPPTHLQEQGQEQGQSKGEGQEGGNQAFSMTLGDCGYPALLYYAEIILPVFGYR